MSGPVRKLLFVEDDLGLQRQLRWSFSDYEVMTASDRAAAISCISIHQPAVVVLDLGLPPDPDGASEGLATLETIRTTWTFPTGVGPTGTAASGGVPALDSVAAEKVKAR